MKPNGWLKRQNQARRPHATGGRVTHPQPWNTPELGADCIIPAKFRPLLANTAFPNPFAKLTPCDGQHRGPQGPNEDLAVCHFCFAPTWTLRPEGEEFGAHQPDCALPRRHESFCIGGGTGHPPPRKTRG